MAYKVKILPPDGPAGWLANGGKSEFGTYYHHPGPAKKAAEGYVKRHPGAICEVRLWRCESLVEEVR